MKKELAKSLTKLIGFILIMLVLIAFIGLAGYGVLHYIIGCL